MAANILIYSVSFFMLQKVKKLHKKHVEYLHENFPIHSPISRKLVDQTSINYGILFNISRNLDSVRIHVNESSNML